METRKHEWESVDKTSVYWCSYNNYRCKNCGDEYKEEIDASGYHVKDTKPKHAVCPGTKFPK